jgi:hypothetical protein
MSLSHKSLLVCILGSLTMLPTAVFSAAPGAPKAAAPEIQTRPRRYAKHLWQMQPVRSEKHKLR